MSHSGHQLRWSISNGSTTTSCSNDGMGTTAGYGGNRHHTLFVVFPLDLVEARGPGSCDRSTGAGAAAHGHLPSSGNYYTKHLPQVICVQAESDTKSGGIDNGDAEFTELPGPGEFALAIRHNGTTGNCAGDDASSARETNRPASAQINRYAGLDRVLHALFPGW